MSGQEDVGTMADMVKGSHGVVIILISTRVQ